MVPVNRVKRNIAVKNYGQGNSTGLEQGAIDSPTTGFKQEDLNVNSEDKGILRNLAERVADIAASNRMAEIRNLWKDHNKHEHKNHAHNMGKGTCKNVVSFLPQ